MAEADSDFNEKQVAAMLDRSTVGKVLSRWVCIGDGCLAIKLNWVTSLGSLIILWVFAGICLGDKENAPTYFSEGKSWVSQNFTWLYVITQDVWCAFLIYLAFSRFGGMKLGRDDEKPRYDNATWFAMLFTCGVAVGLYVFGVSEPLYFYRQPTSWQLGWDYDVIKTSVANDAQRAQQSLFLAIYHWGIHGWVPYILLALLAGIVSFRWNMPMTIRSCFYPLIGDHALGLAGDFIDALSISTTTFGVCTSLGLGVSQLAKGLKFLKWIGCSDEDECVAAGGYWDISGMGANNCFNTTRTPTSCALNFLGNEEDEKKAYYTIITVITVFATLSVLTGLDTGIKNFAKLAFTLGMVVMLLVLMTDNTWYLLSLMVQTLGYYLQYVVQVGFDCEAFQQLNFEWMPGSNQLWGSQGEMAAGSVALSAGLTPAGSSSDCGDQVNPCTKGVIMGLMASAMAGAGATDASLANAKTILTSFKMSDRSITQAIDLVLATEAAGMQRAALCGSGWNTTHFDDFTAPLFNRLKESPLPSALADGTFPRCPETITKDTMSWGMCVSHKFSCPAYTTYFGDTAPEFMNWWTIFYWAWWITWAPFVGFFVALISRGRTVREVIMGGFVCPTLFAVMWFCVFGGLGIKMQRTAELALKVRPDWAHAAVTCAEHYSGMTPLTPEAKALAKTGYYMLSCIPKDDQIYVLMQPYTNISGTLHVCLWFGLVIYFLTSSDSGSMTDDIISASGLSASKIPPWQKVFWCFMEGVVAISLINLGSSGLKALQHVSIIIGLPYTIFLCMMVPALYRVLKLEAGDKDIQESKRFNTQLLDIIEFFKPHGGSPFPPMTHVTNIVVALFVPGLGLYKAFTKTSPDDKVSPILYSALAQFFLVVFFVFHVTEVGSERTKGLWAIGWLAYIFFGFIVAVARSECRRTYNVWGSMMDDAYCGLVMYPLAIAQLVMMVEHDGKDAPLYFESAEQIKSEMLAVMDSPPPPKSVEVVKVTSSTDVETARA